ncbi:hypothetical protein T4D_5869 [Trichinella pseudospiralis]|uniref:Uncharacterized protein n=1 Tax=Trichinella pseudospiralis TaxID=6337 RepID=A0A0V1FHT8_TRIPS|nr:hypothetical protein T4D_5869 [Trichinella pseudospiralis]
MLSKEKKVIGQLPEMDLILFLAFKHCVCTMFWKSCFTVYQGKVYDSLSTKDGIVANLRFDDFTLQNKNN